MIIRKIRGTFSGLIATSHPVAKAAAVTVERLETRTLLSLTPAQVESAWNHMGPVVRHDIAVFEYTHPAFRAELDSQLAAYDLQGIAPQAPSASDSLQSSKVRRRRPVLHPAPRRHKAAARTLHRDSIEAPFVTSAAFNDNYLPNQLTFTFSDNVSSANWAGAVTVINLNTGLSVPVSASYNSASQTVTYNLNNSTILPDANYTAILHGSQISDASDSSLLLDGADSVSGHDYAYNFFFFDADFDGNRAVNAIDLAIMLQNYNRPGSYSQGDANYDGAVNSIDLAAVLQRFNRSLPVLDQPGAPAVTSGSSTTANLIWSASDSPQVTGYDVYRNSQLIASSVSGTSYPDSGLTPGTSYTYFVVARDSANDSSYPSSEVVAATAPQVTAQPVFNSTAMTLTYTFPEAMSAASWDSAISVLNLNSASTISTTSVYNSASNTLTYTLNGGSALPTGNYTAFLHGSMITDPSGAELAGDSGNAGTDVATSFSYPGGNTDLGTSGPPTLQSVGSNSITLTWTNANDSRVTSFDVYRNYQRIAPNQTSMTYVDSGLSSNTTYTYFIVSKDASGDTSSASQELVQTTNPPMPGTPTTPIWVQSTVNSVLISWTDSDPNVISYTITRANPSGPPTVITGIAGTAYLDTGLTANTNYTYTIQAVSPGGLSAASPSLTVTTPYTAPAGYNTTAPAAPASISATDISNSTSVQVTWPSSGSGLTYEVDRNGVQVGVTTGTTIVDATALAGQSYTYSVTAIDASFNRSSATSMTGTVTPAEAVGPNVPIDIQVTQDTSSAVSLSWTAPWDQEGVTQYTILRTPAFTDGSHTPTATTFQDTNVTAGTTYNYIIQAADPAGFTAGNIFPVIVVTPGSATPAAPIDLSPNQIIPADWQDYLYRPTDGLIAVLRQKMAAVGLTPSPVANWYDSTDTVIPGSGSPPSTNSTLVHGTVSGQYAYYDTQNTGQWSPTYDPIWLIASGDGTTYQPGEQIVYAPTYWSGTIPTGTIGRTNGILVGTGAGGLPFVWAESSTFRNDLVSVYSDIERLTPYFAPAGSPIPYSVGSLLQVQAIGAPTIAGTGNITAVDAESNQYTSYTTLTLDSPTNAIAGDNIEIGGKWYTVSGASGNQITLAGYDSSIATGSTYSLINWTKVPATTDSQTGLTFSYERGTPDNKSVLFPQQLAQLQQALNTLSYLPYAYGYWRFDSATSSAVLQVVSSVLSTYDSLFGSTDIQLYSDVEAHDFDPGAIFNYSLISHMESAAMSIAENVYVRGSGTNGWAIDSTYKNNYTFWSIEELPVLFGSSATWRPEDANSQVDSADWSQIQSVINTITNNGLWINSNQDPAVDYSAPIDETVGGPGYQQGDNRGQPLSSWDTIQETLWGSAAPHFPANLGSVEDSDKANDPGNIYPGWAQYGAAGIVVTATVGPGTNPLGGSGLTSLSPGSTADQIREASWTWGATETIVSYSEPTIVGILNSKYMDMISHYSGLTQANLSYQTSVDPGSQYLVGTGGMITATFGSTETYDCTYGIDISIPSPSELYGLVPNNGSFSYNPTGQPLSFPSAGTPPTDETLTTPMDYENTIPDTNLDGIVQVPVDLSTFGNDTGMMAFQADRDGAQSYLPMFTDNTGVLPINGYYEQGAFSLTGRDGSPLLTDENIYSTSNPAGLPYGYSLSTYVRTNLLLDDGVNHIKRIEVIRPGGNAVVFNFPWNSSTNVFSPIGTPMSWNNRDALRTYVLRDLNPQNVAGMSYALEFASGIVQTFASYYGPTAGLASISNAQGLTQGAYGASNRYNVTLNWANGQINSIAYQTKTPNVSAQTITTTIGYNGEQINSLSKAASNGVSMDAFSYALSGNAITRDGVTTTRTGTFANSGSTPVVISQSAADGTLVGSVSYAYKFNTHQMLSSQAVTLVEGDGQTDTETTTYGYASGSRSTVNGYAPWGEVVHITYPDHSWIEYVYQDGSDGVNPATGWVTEQITPFKNDRWTPGNESENVAQYYSYDASLSGNGQGADPLNLVEQPREVESAVLGVITGTTYIRVGGTTSGATAGTENALNIVTAVAPFVSPDGTTPATWAQSVFQTATTIAAAISGGFMTTTTGPSGTSQTQMTSAGGTITSAATQSWMGNTLSTGTSTVNPFGYQSGGTGATIGSPYQSSNTGAADAFGRYTSETASGGVSSGASYAGGSGADANNVGWFGPATVTETDGSTTAYTYNALGEVSAKTIFAGSNHSVQYSYQYDLAGNVTSMTTTAVDMGGTPISSLPVVTNTYDYDALGRLVQEIDNNSTVDPETPTDATSDRTTTYSYDSTTSGTTETINYPNGENETIVTNLDGTKASDLGTATTPTLYDEGVAIGGSLIYDDNGSSAGAEDSAMSDGSTWTSVQSGGTSNVTRTFVNMLGENYLTQKSASDESYPPPMADAVTSFDGNGRPTKFVDVDGTTTYTSYDPTTGQAAMSFVDVNKNGVYDPGIDIRSTSKPTAASSSSNSGGSTSVTLSNKGVQTSTSTTTLSGGVTQSTNANGLTSSTKTNLPTGPGAWKTTTTNPDGTSVVDTYVDGLLSTEQVMATDGVTATTTTSYVYDGLRRLISSTDYTGTTHYTYFEDGTEETVQTPGHNAVAVNAIDQTNNAATSTTRSDSGTISTPQNSLGEASSVSGAGVLPTTFGYDTNGTGQLTSLTTYQGNALGGSTGSATTTWGYDESTGLLKSKTYADGTSDSYGYNNKLQLTSVSEPGITGSSFGYNAAGQQTSSSLTDSATGTVSSSTRYDDMGRPVINAGTDNGKSYSNIVSYNANGQMDQAWFDIAQSNLKYDYYDPSDTSTGASPQALKTTTLNLPNGQTPVVTSYAYDSATGRLQSISVGNSTFTFSYVSGSNQIAGIVAQASGANNGVTTTYSYDKKSTSNPNADPDRLTRISVSASQGGVFVETMAPNGPHPANGYNQQDQIVGQDITRINSDGTSQSDTYVYTYNASQGDALTNVADTVGTTTTNTAYAYDGAGNITSTQVGSNAAASYGSLNSVNEYSTLTYNLRGDLTDDGVYSYGYDANNRLISITPHDTTQYQLRFGYDNQGRRLWKDVYSYVNGVWTFAYSRRYVWDGTNLDAVLDGNNNLLTKYVWGPTGLLAVIDFTVSGGPKVYQAVSDVSGNIVQLIDMSNGTVAADYHYDAYGNLIIPNGANGPAAAACDIRGKSLLTDSEARVILHALLRDMINNMWLEPDPTGTGGGSNPRRLYDGDPINKSDPTGLSADSVSISGRNQYGLSDEQYNAFVGWVTQKYGTGSRAFGRAVADTILRQTGSVDLAGRTPPEIAAMAAGNVQRTAAADQYLRASGYDGSKGMASTGWYLLQGVANVGQAFQDTAIGLLNLGFAPITIGLGLRIPSWQWSQGVSGNGIAANEYGMHKVDLFAAEVGWNLIVPKFLQVGLNALQAAADATSAGNGITIAARQEMVAARTADQIALRARAADLLNQARDGGMTPGLLTSLRNVGANLGWAEEAQMVRITGQGTRAWNTAEMNDLLANGRVAGYTPHHINSVSDNPWLAGNPNNIQIVERWTEHGMVHGGNTMNPTFGDLINRSQSIINWLIGR